MRPNRLNVLCYYVLLAESIFRSKRTKYSNYVAFFSLFLVYYFVDVESKIEFK